MTRREFLYYVWLSSLALFSAQTSGALLWYAFPRIKDGLFGGRFTILRDALPQPGTPPVENLDGHFWLVNVTTENATDPRHPAGYTTQPGLLALSYDCTHLGCRYRWVTYNDRFECPCHGAKFLRDGTRIHFPANRDLDRLPILAINANGSILATTQMGNANDDPSAGQPLMLPEGTVAIVVDTGRRVIGRRNDGPSINLDREY